MNVDDLRVGCPIKTNTEEEADLEDADAQTAENTSDVATRKELTKKDADRVINYLLSVCNFRQFHSGIYGNGRGDWMERARDNSKVAQLAESLKEDPRKTLIIVNRRQGYRAVEAYLREHLNLKEYRSSMRMDVGEEERSIDVCGDGTEVVTFEQFFGKAYPKWARNEKHIWRSGTFKMTVNAEGRSLNIPFVYYDGEDYRLRKREKGRYSLEGLSEIWLPKVGENGELRNLKERHGTIIELVQHTPEDENRVQTKSLGTFNSERPASSNASRARRVAAVDKNKVENDIIRKCFVKCTVAPHVSERCTPSKPCWLAAYSNTCKEKRTEFNADDNHPVRGEKQVSIQVMVVEAENFGTGSDFYGVQRLILLSPPTSWGALKQQVGRVTRSCDQPAKDGGRIDVELWVSTFEDGDSFKTADEIVVEQLQKQGNELELALKNVKNNAFDGDLYNSDTSGRDPCKERRVVNDPNQKTFLEQNGATTENGKKWLLPAWARKVPPTKEQYKTQAVAHRMLKEKIERLTEPELKFGSRAITVDGITHTSTAENSAYDLAKVDTKHRDFVLKKQRIERIKEDKEFDRFWIGGEGREKYVEVLTKLLNRRGEQKDWEKLNFATYATGEYEPRKTGEYVLYDYNGFFVGKVIRVGDDTVQVLPTQEWNDGTSGEPERGVESGMGRGIHQPKPSAVCRVHGGSYPQPCRGGDHPG